MPAFRNTASPGWGVNHADRQAPFHLQVLAASCRLKYLVSGQHIPGFVLQPPALPTLRSLGSRPLAAGLSFAFVGCTWTESISRASRNFSNNGNRRKRPPNCPSICSGNCFSN